MARNRLTDEELLDSVGGRLAAGDFQIEPLPQGHDPALLSAIIHMNGIQENRYLYSRVYHCLLPGRTILIRDHVMDPSRTTPMDRAIFAVNMLTATSAGNSYTLEEMTEDLPLAGFTGVHLSRDRQDMDQLVVGTKG